MLVMHLEIAFSLAQKYELLNTPNRELTVLNSLRGESLTSRFVHGVMTKMTNICRVCGQQRILDFWSKPTCQK